MIGGRAVCFDAYGTMVEAGSALLATRSLLKTLRGDPRAAMIALMKGQATFRSLAAEAGFDPACEIVRKAERDVLAEADSVRLIQGMGERWAAVRAAGKRIAICSNLGEAFVAPLLRALPDAPDAAILSCVAGHVKPEREIYALVAERLDLHPSEILFVGDNLRNDVEAPREFGMQAMPVELFRELPDLTAA